MKKPVVNKILLLNCGLLHVLFSCNTKAPDWMPAALAVHEGEWKLIRQFFHSSADLVNWKLECDILPEETFINAIQSWFREIKGNYLKGAYYLRLLKIE